MAIFTSKADLDLPLWTQLLQVDVPAGWHKDPALLFGSEMEDWWRRQQDYTPRGIASGIHPDPTLAVKALPHLAQMREWGGAILTGIADGTPIPRPAIIEAINEMEVLRTNIGQPDDRLPGHVIDPRDKPDGPPILAADLIIVDHSVRRMSRTEASLLLAVNDIVSKKVSVKRCKFCGHPFVMSRPDQTFCSRRDGLRAAAQQQYLRKKLLKAA